MSDKLKCIIVDDDKIAIKVMEGLIEKTEFLEHVKSIQNPLQAMDFWAKNNIDILFLDVEMPELSGLDLIKVVPTDINVVIMSSKREYALDAFDFNVSDFLLKPIDDYNRFLKAALRVRKRILDGQSQSKPVQSEKGQEQDKPDNIFIKVDSLLVNLGFDKILWLEAFGDYVKVVTDERTYTVYATLKSVEKKMPSNAFQRVHRSYIVNLKKIKNIDLSNLQIANKVIPISSSHKETLMNKLNTL